MGENRYVWLFLSPTSSALSGEAPLFKHALTMSTRSFEVATSRGATALLFVCVYVCVSVCEMIWVFSLNVRV